MTDDTNDWPSKRSVYKVSLGAALSLRVDRGLERVERGYVGDIGRPSICPYSGLELVGDSGGVSAIIRAA